MFGFPFDFKSVADRILGAVRWPPDKPNASRDFRNSKSFRRRQAELSARGSFRPSIPPLAVCAICAWIFCAHTYTQGFGLSSKTCLLGAVLSACAAAALCVLVAARPKTALLALCALGIAAGNAMGLFGAYGMHKDFSAVEEMGYGRYTAEIGEDAVRNDRGWTAAARLRDPQGATVLARIYGSGDDLPRYGEVLAFDADPKAPSEPYAAARWSKGIAADASVGSYSEEHRSGALSSLASFRSDAIDAIESCGCSDSSAAVLSALVCGYRTEIYELDDYTSFTTAGIAHIVAVSGSHMSLVAALIVACMRRCKIPGKAASLVSLAGIAAYLVIAAAPLSAVRAAIMASLAIAAPLVNRRSASLNALGFSAFAFLALDPSASVSISLVLSAASTAAIILLAPLFSEWFAGLRALPGIIADSLALTFASSVAAIPLSAAYFSQISLIAPITNILAAPLFTFAYVGGLAGVVLQAFIPALGQPILQAAALFADAMRCVAIVCAQVPYAALPATLPVFAAVALMIVGTGLLWRFWPAMTIQRALAMALAAALAVLMAFFVVPAVRPDQIIALDVGQGDAFLVRTRGATLLIDTGNQDAKLKAALAREGVTSIDAVIVTHADDDHCGSLDALRSVASVRAVYIAQGILTCEAEACASLVEEACKTGDVYGLSVGDAITMGRFSFSVIWPDALTSEGGNADSLCLRMEYAPNAGERPTFSALWCGDAEAAQIRAMIEEGRVGDIDLLKVGHHGSKAALDASTLAVLDPEIALIGVGRQNRYGHPAPALLSALEEQGCKTYRTDTSGDIVCALSEDRVEVRTLR